MPYELHGDTERARETLWARKEDAKALEALRRRIESENTLADKLEQVQAQAKPKG